jgi:uncharacterized protein involved in oxidation of intracellular sulfur
VAPPPPLKLPSQPPLTGNTGILPVPKKDRAMQILLIISNADPEIKWNAVRLGNHLLNEGDEVTIFLNGPAVDLVQGNSEQFPIAEQAKLFTLSEGVLLA